MVSRRRGPRGTWALAAVFSVAFGACLFTPDNAVGPCGAEGCDDGNPCTDDVCAQDGFCDHLPSAKIPDDGVDCTEDYCDGAEERHPLKDDGADCGQNGMLKCEAGECKCQNNDQCGVTDTCATHTCDKGTCRVQYAAVHTFVDAAGDKDCKLHECDGAGLTVEAPDLADIPDDPVDGDCKKLECNTEMQAVEVNDDGDFPGDIDGNPCTASVCSDGTPMSDPAPADDTPCGEPTCTAAGDAYSETPAPKCKGGQCMTPPAVSCGSYKCASDGKACSTSCSSSGDCAPSAYCSMGGNCTPKSPNGSTCFFDIQCQSGICNPEGLCCNEECNVSCKSCFNGYTGGANGACLPIKNKTDPYNDCPNGGCDFNSGAHCCNGNGACNP